ncbi:MAG: hypothetical protein ICV87_09300 [Gemmatimonadetes bacterium]|nr:hypothetical protein [Gemmatimonadota bacterium]
MYRHCIYCSADLGANEAVEGFPVGRTLAYDAVKGRLWAVCAKCARWNLAPIEERWEVIEDAERIFRDTRLRVQSENVGLAKLRDGTRLIRVGAALQGEMAAWRYGSTLEQRRKKYLVGSAVVAAGTTAVFGGMMWAGMSGLLWVVGNAWQDYQRKRVVHHVPAHASPDGRMRTIRRWHVEGAWLDEDAASGIALHVPDTELEKPKTDWSGKPRFGASGVVALVGRDARRALERSLVRVNEKGGKRDQLREAVGLIAASSPEEYIRATARRRVTLGKRGESERGPSAFDRRDRRVITPVHALALEMALHEEQERRAMEGELSILEAAWRDAEPIAAIADRLALDPGARE